jgi:small subunit ribosomal protein S2
MRTITLEELLEAGCHFGHQVTRSNPKARDYIFEARDNVHIIDLAKTKEGLEEAAVFVRDLAKKGGTMIVLGSKKQAQQAVRDEVKRAQDEQATGIYFVTNRWIGGLLTNFPEVMKNFKKLHTINKIIASKEEKAKYTKKEIALWEREKAKLESFYGGVADMIRVPDAVFIVDTHQEDIAVREAITVNVKTVGITDTNADPTKITYAIPANDDALGSIKLLLGFIVDAWIEGKKQAGKEVADQAKKVQDEVDKQEKIKADALAKVKADAEAAEKAAVAKKEQNTKDKLASLKAENKAAAEKAAKKS